MSTDENYTEDLVQTAEDGKEGYAKGAEELADSDHAEFVTTFRDFSEQRQGFADELRGMASAYGDNVNEGGSVAAAAHRGWMALKDAVTGSGPESVLKTALQGEDHAIKEYEKALEQDLSADLRTLVERQLQQIKSARHEVSALLERVTS